MTETRDKANHSEASREARIRELAVLDWARMPSTQVRERMGDVDWQTLCAYRNTPLYEEVRSDLRAEWEAEMLRLPGYRDLKKKVEQAVALGIDAVIEILADSGAANKDKIAAARLAAQMDGRFLKASENDPGDSKDSDSLGKKLLDALERQTRVQ